MAAAESSSVSPSSSSTPPSSVLVEDAIREIVSAGYDATCDNPLADVFQDQLEMYPDAKVILTVRDSAEKWAGSWKTLGDFIEVQERTFSLRYPTFIQWIPLFRNWKCARNVMGIHLGLKPGEIVRDWRDKPDGWLEEQYRAHNNLVRNTVPNDRLLVFNVKEGWEPLCDFLGKEVPNGVPFPNVNESADLKRARTIMKFVSYAWIPMVLATTAASLVVAFGCVSPSRLSRK